MQLHQQGDVLCGDGQDSRSLDCSIQHKLCLVQKRTRTKYRSMTVEYEASTVNKGPIGQYCLYRVVAIHIKAERSKRTMILESDQLFDEAI